MLGLIANNDETAYRKEIEHLATWCTEHNLALNVKKSKEGIVEFRKKGQPNHTPLFIGSEEVQQVPSFKFLGLTVSEDLSWSINTASAAGKAQQCLSYLRKLRRAKLPKQILVNFYHCAIENVLTYGLLCGSPAALSKQANVHSRGW